ncbi:MAG: lysine biosynthesis protein LysW [Candidatus Micrarchaeota archaeon]|nr:lysine biosynthesis protein LysW [Candidatus Micrarchaeota archaeon]
MSISECPVCTYHIALPQYMKEGDEMPCPDCGAFLRLVSLSPPIFKEIKGEE